MLMPLLPGEGISVHEAAQAAETPERTMRAWCADHRIGRKVAGQWRVSRVALMMLLAGDREALSTYCDGDRSDPKVVGYFARAGMIICEHLRLSEKL